MTRPLADVVAAVEERLGEALTFELREAIELEGRRQRNAGTSTAWAAARREFEQRQREHAEALAAALADVRREVAPVEAERDKLRAELEAIRGADTPEIAASVARLKALAAGRRPGRIA